MRNILETKSNGKVYHFDSWHEIKPKASLRASSLRNVGLLAIVKDRSSHFKPKQGRKGYAVFVRSK